MGSREPNGDKIYGGREDKIEVKRTEGEYWKRNESNNDNCNINQPIKNKVTKQSRRRRKNKEWIGKLNSVWNSMPHPIKKGIINIKSVLQYLGLISPPVKVAPIESRVQERHLELEPLCCLSSCLVRGGCMAVLSFQLFYASILCIYVFVRMWRKERFELWRPIHWEIQQLISHHIFLYLLLAVAITTVIMSLLLLRGLVCFDKRLLFIHLKFHYVLFAFNFLFSLLFALALASEGRQAWNFLNILLFLNFVLQLPVQLWAISVVRSCADFFSLIQIFLRLAEK